MEDTNKELNTPDNSVPRPVDVAGGEGGGNDSDVKSLAEVVNHAWGTNFKDDASALQGLQDNAVFRGKLGKYRPLIEKLESTKGGENQALKYMEEITNQNPAPASQPPAPAPDLSGFISKAQYEKDMFFSSHPELKAHEELLDALKLKNPGKSWDELKELPSFKPVLEADDLKNNRPLTSSPRVVTPPSPAEKQQAMKDALHSNKIGEYLINENIVPIPQGPEV